MLTEPVANAATAGTAYLALLQEELTEERARKASLEARGAAIITTSGALVTLLFALSALVSDQGGFVLPPEAQGALRLSVVLFLVAATAGLLVSFPMPYREVTAEAFDDMIEDWAGDAVAGQQRAARARANVYRKARKLNGWKALIVLAGMAFEVGAVLFVAYAARSILTA